MLKRLEDQDVSLRLTAVEALVVLGEPGAQCAEEVAKTTWWSPESDLAALGGSGILSEFPELCGVEHELVARGARRAHHERGRPAAGPGVGAQV